MAFTSMSPAKEQTKSLISMTLLKKADDFIT